MISRQFVQIPISSCFGDKGPEFEARRDHQFLIDFFSGMGGGAGAGVPPVANPEEHYASQLEQLEMMGFTNRAANIEELQRTQGNVEAAVDRLLARPR